MGAGRVKSRVCPQVAEDGAVSTFLKETDLAGLKVCSVRSSPSIVSVQSERGASCNSKLSRQSPPGPAVEHQREHRMEPAESMQRDSRPQQCSGDGGATCKHGPQNQDHSWPTSENATTITNPGESCLKHSVATSFSEITTYTIICNVP